MHTNTAIDKFIPTLTSQKISIQLRHQKDKEDVSNDDPIVGQWSKDVVPLIGKYGQWVELTDTKTGGSPVVGKLMLSAGFAPIELDKEGSANDTANSK